MPVFPSLTVGHTVSLATFVTQAKLASTRRKDTRMTPLSPTKWEEALIAAFQLPPEPEGALFVLMFHLIIK